MRQRHHLKAAGHPLLAFKTPDSIKGWQWTYFYVRNQRSDQDRIG